MTGHRTVSVLSGRIESDARPGVFVLKVRWKLC